MRDIYVYDNTDVLINKFNEKDFDRLKDIEADITGAALADLLQSPVEGDFDSSHLCEIHRRIFGDIFDWAGEFRKVNIEKPEAILKGLSVDYSDLFDIRKDLNPALPTNYTNPWYNLSGGQVIRK